MYLFKNVETRIIRGLLPISERVQKQSVYNQTNQENIVRMGLSPDVWRVVDAVIYLAK